jgi:hypothetical protein
MYAETDKNTPLRLEEAVKIAFPNGGMKVAGLRRAIHNGTLSHEKMAGKYFVTLADIEEMRRLCRVEAKGLGSNFVPPGTIEPETSPTTQPGSSETAPSSSALDALNAKLKRLSEPSKTT